MADITAEFYLQETTRMEATFELSQGGSKIKVGNQSALDLLIEMNEAKKNLAINLQGKGIDANASEETLGELVSKVPDILSSSDREIVECITTNFNFSNTWNNANDLSSAKIKGYYFYHYKNNANLKYFKISDIEQRISDNTNTDISSMITSVNCGTSMYIGKILHSPDYSKIYVVAGTGSSNQIRQFDVTWDGDTITNVVFNSNINIAGSSTVNTASLDSTGKKLIFLRNGDDKKCVWMYNFETGVTSEVTGTRVYFNSVSNFYYRFFISYVGDNEFVVCGVINDRYVQAVHFSLNGTEATLIANNIGSYQITNTSFASDLLSSKARVVEYEEGKYKILIPLEPYTTSKNALKLATYDTYTKSLIEYRTNIRTIGFNSNTSNLNNPNPIDIVYDATLQRYVAISGVDFFVFDKSLNLLNSFNVNCVNTNNYVIGAFFAGNGRLMSIFYYNDGKVMKFPFWYGKKTMMRRTVSIDGTSKNFYYAPSLPIQQSEIEEGWFD